MAIETLITRVAPHLLPTLSAFFVVAYNYFIFEGSNTKISKTLLTSNSSLYIRSGIKY